jgi:hypothetical protein
MKKIALITASLAMLASPVFAEEAKTVGAAPAEAKFSTVSKDEFQIESGDHTRIAFTRDAAGKVTGAVLNPGPWEQRGALVQ